jgi:hypothetical protein
LWTANPAILKIKPCVTRLTLLGVTVTVIETLDTRDSLVMPNPKGHEDSIRDSRFKAAWQSGPTRTIRVPIVLADPTLDYARKLDQGVEPRDTRQKANDQPSNSVAVGAIEPRDTQGKITTLEDDPVDTASSEPRDTVDDIISAATGVNTTQSHDTRDLIDEVTWLKAENKRLQNLLSDLRVELNDTLKNAPVVLEFEPPEAADLLNRLKAKRKKSTASLADIEAILEMIEE